MGVGGSLGLGGLDVDRGQRGGVVHTGEAVGQVVEQSLAYGVVDAVHAGHVASHLVGALGESGPEFGHLGRLGGHLLLHLQVLQVFDGHLQDVGLFEFGVAGILRKKEQ